VPGPVIGMLLLFAYLLVDKGRVLAQMSDFWFNKLRHIVPTHETGIAPETVVAPNEVDQVRDVGVVGGADPRGAGAERVAGRSAHAAATAAEAVEERHDAKCAPCRECLKVTLG